MADVSGKRFDIIVASFLKYIKMYRCINVYKGVGGRYLTARSVWICLQQQQQQQQHNYTTYWIVRVASWFGQSPSQDRERDTHNKMSKEEEEGAQGKIKEEEEEE
jgi:hypothetical protein